MVECHISHHYLIYIVLNLKIRKPPPNRIITRRFQQYHASKFLQDLERLPWKDNSLTSDVSERVDDFNQNLLIYLVLQYNHLLIIYILTLFINYI